MSKKITTVCMFLALSFSSLSYGSSSQCLKDWVYNHPTLAKENNFKHHQGKHGFIGGGSDLIPGFQERVVMLHNPL